ncbi:major facilitator superfamily domain-containing protein [Leptodontidium sp. 2 PMI_412]|nr:major facilitator superfamily domain-containing protein [Leptodontidium sp. 2 PMI_412]
MEQVSIIGNALGIPGKITYGDHHKKAEAFITQEALAPLDQQIERVLTRKLDILVMPILTINFMFAFVDRANLGNSKIVGLEKDLGMHGYDFNWASTAFYFTYILIELPSNIILRKIGPRIYLSALCFCFGIITFSTAFIQNFRSLIAERLLLGLAEGGLLPGYAYYLSTLYPRYELGARITGMMTASLSSGFVGGFLALGFANSPPFGQIHTWRHIYFFEGIISMALAIVTFIVLPNGIKDAWFLSESEKRVGLERLRRQELEDFKPTITREHIRQGVMNINNWLAASIYAFMNVPVQSCILFLPTIIHAMGYTSSKAQIMSGAPFLVGTFILAFQGILSDKLKRRGLVVLIFVPFMALCFMLLLIFTLNGPALLHRTGLRYMALFLGVSLGTCGGPLCLAWATNNTPSAAVRAVTTALIVGMGTVGAFIASWTYTNKNAPLYITGHSINLGFSLVAIGLIIAYWAYCSWENHQRDLGRRDHRLGGLSHEEMHNLGHKHPEFRYAS